ncbi:hypothetical protein HmCmsJML270_00761 [Escherichia coli]|nr:hypothetical protein HmCmsJML270_00761 [Escherichia coli]
MILYICTVCGMTGDNVNERELLEIVRPDGRYELISQGGKFIVRPLRADEIIISPESHRECKKRFSNTQTELQ